ncbi:MAG TPA: M23 family metallopeptidase [Puia sp.]
MRHLLAAACSLFSLLCSAQVFLPVTYPRDYFRDPLNIPMSLAANFGELRPDHYHMGLDIRTQKRENLPVFAAADGYIARVSITPAGFGQAIYLRHPNGYTTVYGHLNQFFPALAAWVREQQYRQQSWQVSLDIPPSLFPVKKGSLIAYSGNTGGSQGPHLHFEIRRTEDDVNLNPLLFGLPVPDNTPPVILRLAWYDRNQSIYEQTPHMLAVHKGPPASPHKTPSASPASFSITPALLTVPFTRISFAISAFDTQTGSANPNGIFQAVLYDDGQPVIGFQMNDISYDNTRNINAHIDYKTRATGGPFLQQLFFLPGYPLPSIYRSFTAARTPPVDPAATGLSPRPADGTIDLGDGRPHTIRIEVKDAYDNASALSYRVQFQPPPAGGNAGSPAAAGGVPVIKTAGKKFYPGMVDGLETAGCAFYIGEKGLYDSVTLAATVAGYPRAGYSLPGAVSATYKIGEPWIPLLEPVLVRLMNTRAVRMDSLPGSQWQASADHIVMVCFQGQGTQKDVQRPEWHEGWASARFREFGNFQLVDDSIPPVITPLTPLEGADLSKASRIAFSVKDNLDAIRHFRAELDGRWLCFTNDKGLAYIYKFDEHCPPGRHMLKVTAEDVAGNRTVKEYRFTR